MPSSAKYRRQNVPFVLSPVTKKTVHFVTPVMVAGVEKSCYKATVPPASLHPAVTDWVEECARLTQPDRIHWCDGSDEEYRALIAGMVQDATLLALNPQKYP